MHRMVMLVCRALCMMVPLGYDIGLDGLMFRAYPAIKHRCRSKALHGQSQYDEPEQK